MKLLTIPLPTLTLFLTLGNLQAGSEYADLEDFPAYFPSPPKQVATLGYGSTREVIYCATDAENRIWYSLQYQVEPNPLSAERIEATLREKAAQSVAGLPKLNLSEIVFTRMGDIPTVSFSCSYEKNKVTVFKYSIIAYYKERVVNWSVQDYGKFSIVSAKRAYESKLDHFLRDNSTVAEK